VEILKVNNLSKVYGKGDTQIKAIDNVSFSVEKGEFVSIVGPSGSGKSTLARAILALPRPERGEVEIDGEGRIFLVNRVERDNQSYEALVFLAQVTKRGEVFLDRDSRGNPVVTHRVRPFPLQAGRSEIKNGRVIFPDTQQRPQVPVKKTEPDEPIQ